MREARRNSQLLAQAHSDLGREEGLVSRTSSPLKVVSQSRREQCSGAWNFSLYGREKCRCPDLKHSLQIHKAERDVTKALRLTQGLQGGKKWEKLFFLWNHFPALGPAQSGRITWA